MIKDEDIKEPTYGNLDWNAELVNAGVKWPYPVEDVPHPPKWLWTLWLIWGVFVVGLLLGVVLAE